MADDSEWNSHPSIPPTTPSPTPWLYSGSWRSTGAHPSVHWGIGTKRRKADVHEMHVESKAIRRIERVRAEIICIKSIKMSNRCSNGFQICWSVFIGQRWHGVPTPTPRLALTNVRLLTKRRRRRAHEEIAGRLFKVAEVRVIHIKCAWAVLCNLEPRTWIKGRYEGPTLSTPPPPHTHTHTHTHKLPVWTVCHWALPRGASPESAVQRGSS